MTTRDKSPPQRVAGSDPHSSNHISKNMKSKISLHLRMIVPALLLLSCTNSMETMTSYSPVILQSDVLAACLNRFTADNLSMQNIPALAKISYEFDFDVEYGKVISRLTTTHLLQVASLGQDLAMSDMALVLQNNGVIQGTPSYRYLENIMNLFDSERSVVDMAGAFNRLRSAVLSDETVTKLDRDRLAMTFTLLINNYDGIVKGIEASLKAASSERTEGFFTSRVWRVIRSVVVAVSIGVMVGVSEGPYVAVAAAVVMGAAAYADAAVNDNCHFAVQCSGGWRQDCNTGECKPYIK